MAVDDIASPSAATSTICHGNCQAGCPNQRPNSPAAGAKPTISAAEPSNCTLPPAKIGRRIAHRRRGSHSSPTRNNISTTPNPAKCRIDAGSLTSFSPQGPMTMPAARNR